MFMRLTSCSDSDAQRRRIPADLAGREPDPCLSADRAGRGASDVAVVSARGAIPEPLNGRNQIVLGYAPGASETTSSRSTTASVDIAGWTEVVIQGGRRVLPDVICGHSMAEVNASINRMLRGARPGCLQFRRIGGGNSDGSPYGCLGFSDNENGTISCSNNNEVTI